MCLHCVRDAGYAAFAARGERRQVPAGLGRRRFLVALVGVSGAVVVGCARPGLQLVSEEQVLQLGLESWERIRRETPPSRKPEYQQAAQAIARDLLRAAGEDSDAWEVVVFVGAEPNAFALPGNKIGVYEGMFEVATDASRLAAVLGHEIGHNRAKHAVQRLSRLAATQLGLQMVSVALRVGNIAYANQIAALLGAGVQYGVILPYSRRQELEADEIALFLMARSAYDPRGAIALWQRMRELSGASPLAFLSTHPAPDERMAHLERLLPEALEIWRRARAGPVSAQATEGASSRRRGLRRQVAVSLVPGLRPVRPAMI